LALLSAHGVLDALKTCNAGMIKLQMSALDTENYDEWLVLGLQTNHMYHLLAHDSQIKDEKKSCIASTHIDVALCSFAKWTKKNKDTHIVHNVKECDDDGAREKKMQGWCNIWGLQHHFLPQGGCKGISVNVMEMLLVRTPQDSTILLQSYGGRDLNSPTRLRLLQDHEH